MKKQEIDSADKRLDLYYACDSKGVPLYTTQQLKEMSDKEVESNWLNLECDKVLIDAIRKESRKVYFPPKPTTRQVIGEMMLVVSIGLGVGMGLALIGTLLVKMIY